MTVFCGLYILDNIRLSSFRAATIQMRLFKIGKLVRIFLNLSFYYPKAGGMINTFVISLIFLKLEKKERSH